MNLNINYICANKHSPPPDLCSDLPELEIVSLLSEGRPNYTLRADSVFGYDNDDWLHTPLLPPTVALGLTYEQIDETLKYFCEYCFMCTKHTVCSDGISSDRLCGLN